MKKAKRIGLSLFDEDVRQMIESGMSIVPITQEMVDDNLNPNELVYGRVDRNIYLWLDGHWDYIIADDIDIKWDDVKEKPTNYPPSTHVHDELHTHNNKTLLDSIVENNIHTHTNKTLLDSITSTLVNKWNTVTGKADIGHTHDYSPSTHVHDERYYDKSEVDSKLLAKSDSTHNHDGAYWTRDTPLPKGDKGDKPAHVWTGTKLAFENPNGVMGVAVDLKGDSPEYLAGNNIIIDDKYISATTDAAVINHMADEDIHTSAVEKTIWNNKVSISIGSLKPIDGSIWYEEV